VSIESTIDGVLSGVVLDEPTLVVSCSLITIHLLSYIIFFANLMLGDLDGSNHSLHALIAKLSNKLWHIMHSNTTAAAASSADRRRGKFSMLRFA